MDPDALSNSEVGAMQGSAQQQATAGPKLATIVEPAAEQGCIRSAIKPAAEQAAIDGRAWLAQHQAWLAQQQDGWI